MIHNHKFSNLFYSFIILIILQACGKQLPDLTPIDLNQWKDDKGGCSQFRFRFIDQVTAQVDEFKGLSESQIIEVLGKPDRNELYKRNQKFYYYDLEPGLNCKGGNNQNLKLIIRFNAMGMAKEVAIDKVIIY